MTNHLIIDAQRLGRGGDFLLADEQRVKDFLSAVINAIGMNVLAGPETHRGNTDLPGVTGFAIIETSHINIHTFTRTGDVRFDCYSCVEFDAEKVKEIFDRYYPCEIANVQEVARMPIVTSDYRAHRKEGT